MRHPETMKISRTRAGLPSPPAAPHQGGGNWWRPRSRGCTWIRPAHTLFREWHRVGSRGSRAAISTWLDCQCRGCMRCCGVPDCSDQESSTTKDTKDHKGNKDEILCPFNECFPEAGRDGA